MTNFMPFVTSTAQRALDKVPTALRHTALLRTFGATKVPLIALLRPQVLVISHEVTKVRLPLWRLSRNHLGSMYFGALMVGADCCAGLATVQYASGSQQGLSPSFKAVNAEFLRRAMGDVEFSAYGTDSLREAVTRSLTEQVRVNHDVEVLARCPSIDTDEVVARFTMTVSVKATASKLGQLF